MFELELYPLRLIVCSCDDLGNKGDRQRDLLFSFCIYGYVCIFLLHMYIDMCVYVLMYVYDIIYMYIWICICFYVCI
jgi:hypothetical protein